MITIWWNCATGSQPTCWPNLPSKSKVAPNPLNCPSWLMKRHSKDLQGLLVFLLSSFIITRQKDLKDNMACGSGDPGLRIPTGAVCFILYLSSDAEVEIYKWTFLSRVHTYMNNTCACTQAEKLPFPRPQIHHHQFPAVREVHLPEWVLLWNLTSESVQKQPWFSLLEFWNQTEGGGGL